MVTLDQAGAATLSLGPRPPGADLRPWIEHLWLETFAGSRTPSRGPWRIVPDPAAHVLYHRFRGGDDPLSRLLLVGPRSIAIDTLKSRRSTTLGARVRPGAVPAIFGLRASELTDRDLDLESVLGREGRDLRAELDDAAAERTPRLLSAWLRRRIAEADEPDPRLVAAVRGLSRSGATCRDVADRAGIGTRALRSLVGRGVGLAPKSVSRIVRLHGALRRAGAGRGRRSWSRVAVASGYFDQAHLIREFRRLLGETPEAWRARAVRAEPGGGDG